MSKTENKKIFSILKISLLSFLFLINFSQFFVSNAYAQAGADNLYNNTKVSNNNNIIKINNPLGGRINNLPAFIYMALGFVFRIGAIVSVLALMYVGFMFVKARGEPEELATARRAFLYTVIGIGVLLGGVLIASIIQNTVGEVSRGVI